MTLAVDWETLAPVPAEFLDARLQGRHADLLFAACLVGDPARRAYLLLEHKSKSDPKTALQLLRYTVLVFHRHRELHPGAQRPAVIPVLIHHGRRPWDPDRTRAPAGRRRALEIPGAVAPYLADARLVIFDLARRKETELMALAMPPLGRLALLAMQCVAGRPPDAAEACLRRWTPLLRRVQAEDPGEGFAALSSYVLYTTQLAPERLARLMAELIGSNAEETVMSTANKLFLKALEEGRAKGHAEGREEGHQQGRQEGRQEGREEGREEGRTELLLRQLAARFGPLTPATEQRVRAGTAPDLERWAIAVLAAETLDQVFRGQP